jgi:mannitol/fructose-specific phosphotransferase system IIA component (Ntr-type)
MSEITTTLADYTLPELILPELRLDSTAAAVAELCRALARAGRVPDGLAFYAAVMHREQICSTATPEGWALPHARIKGLAQLSFAVGKIAVPMDWMETRGQAVRLVFLCAVPEGDTTYLRFISALARLSQDPVRRNELQGAADREAVLQVLREVALSRPPVGYPMA